MERHEPGQPDRAQHVGDDVHVERFYTGYAGASRAADRASAGVPGKGNGAAARWPSVGRASSSVAMTTTILGGVLIGTAAGLLFLLEGRIAGVSGILVGGSTRSRSGAGGG